MSTPMPPRVTIAQGELEGVWRGPSAAFLGVPFAEPPVGTLKFLRPVAARRWEGLRMATHYGPTAQRRPFGPDPTIPEPSIPGDDILTVNIFTPRPEARAPGFPVLVWIHGGGFKAGSPASPWYDGAEFNRDGVVTVTVGYRLGFDGFGWVDDAPLNRGVLDWIAALEWVRDNISAFGGDPGRVTIAGQSAGGGAVLALLACPEARGLFHGAIAHSAAYRGADADRAEWLGRRLAHLAGVRPVREAVATLDEDRVLDLQDELESQLAPPPTSVDEVVATLSEEGPDGLPFTPVGDGDLLPRTFAEAAALSADVPLLIGTVEHEFTAAGRGLARALGDTTPSDVLDRLLHGFAADYAAAHPELAPADLLGQIVTDEIFRIPAVEASEARPANTWLYDFRRPGPSGTAVHCTELPFVFDCLDAEKVEAACGPNPPASLARAMHADWVRFITTGAPGWTPLAEGGFPTRVYGGPAGDSVDQPGYAIERRLRDVLSGVLAGAGTRSTPIRYRGTVVPDFAAAHTEPMPPWGHERRDEQGLPDLEFPEMDESGAWRDLARARVTTICQRGTPLRLVLPSPVSRVGRLQFADGTVLLGHAEHSGGLASLAYAASRRMIRDTRRVPVDSLDLVFHCASFGTIRVSIVGIDQPD